MARVISYAMRSRALRDNKGRYKDRRLLLQCLAPLAHALGNCLFVTLIAGAVELLADERLRQVVLGDVVPVIVVRIFVALAVPQAFGIATGILQLLRHLGLAFLFDQRLRLVNGE